MSERALCARGAALFEEQQLGLCRQTDRLFAGLAVFQWLAGIAAALALGPSTSDESGSPACAPVYAAVFVGAALLLPGFVLALRRPGSRATRHAIALGQGLFSLLLIHVTGGRFESHFHVFGALAFLALYRDWRVLLHASCVIVAGHFVRGHFWPASAYGLDGPQSWRWLEHAGWIAFEDVFLVAAGLRAQEKMRSLAQRQALVEAAKEQVEAQVRERTRELAEARDQALEGSRQKSAFLANMSHEIRTPVNGILGSLEALLESGLQPAQAEQALALSACSTQLVALLGDVLDYSSIESGRLEILEQEFDLHALCEEVQRRFAAEARAKGLALELRLREGLPRSVRGDPVRLRQALHALASNAVKFTAQGWIAIDVERGAEDAQGVRVRFAVRDTGIGIAEERRWLLFRPFTQLDSSPTRSRGGAGLGLALAKRLVEGMHGTIGFESEPGAGSTFWFAVPLARGAAAARPEPAPALPSAPPPRAGPARLRVLVVDDNVLNQRIAVRIVEKLGHTCLRAANGEMALASIEIDQPDIVLMDCQMPVLDGYAATRQLRRREGTGRHTIVIALTANALLGDREKCLEAGMDDYLAKPFERADLEALIERWGGRRPALSA